ncbi:MAG: hypothetical protein KA603_12080 [Azonexus sp.]|nr:hypothetical protein [Betaproteobacteria bacterium]MBP6036862.1 hypothetical protein [Azonexus sp.]MBP6907397.1 hypothetical protein [Azonexus sp.]
MGGIADPALRARLLEFLDGDEAAYPRLLEQQFPRIAAKVVELWGTAEFDHYLEGLMVSDRPDRQGFPPDVAMEIFRLSMVHGALGLSSKISGTGWAGIDDGELYRKSMNRG